MTESCSEASSSRVVYRSPFRYPGGKSWLIPLVRLWLDSQEGRPRLLVEPFAGGGIVSLTAAFENLVDEVLMVELDTHVAGVWESILNGHGTWLAKKVAGFDLTRENVEAELARNARTTHTRAFQTLLRNRVSRSGILAPGAGLLRRGENGRGIGSRWYPGTLRKRIEDIMELRDRVGFMRQDGIQVMRKHASAPDTVFFIDPPYVSASMNRLYRCGNVDHTRVFRTAAELTGDFLMSYDDNPLARQLASRHSFEVEEVAMRNAHHNSKVELLIGRNLKWVREPPGRG